MDRSTKFFKTCLGVFQGGGCRAVALAGAYKAALDRGVYFSQVAGTSAGSIVAALIGARAEPEFIIEALGNVRFANFLLPPEKKPFSEAGGPWRRAGIRCLSLVGPQWLRTAARAFIWGGIHSSGYIEEWMDEQLAALLPGERRPVRFGALPVPTYIVATDLQSSEAKVWSSFDTKDDSVAFAVRASCSIPFFFQPVQHGSNRFVDGGVLSNLPAFVFAGGPQDNRATTDRILAFQLKAAYEPASTWSTLETASKLGNAIVDGATHLQSTLQSSVHSVCINTGRVRATDFDKMDDSLVKALIDAGFTATTKFIDQEMINLRPISSQRPFCFDLEDIYSVVVDQASRVFSEALVAERDSNWIWKLFPTVLYWRMKGVRLRVLLEPIRQMDDRAIAYERARRALLSGLGASIDEVDPLPLKGYIFDGNDGNNLSAVIINRRENDKLPLATCYSGAKHLDAITVMYERLSGQLRNVDQVLRAPELTPYDSAALCQNIHDKVRQYASQGVEVTAGTVRVRDLMLTSGSIREYKYRQIDRLVNQYPAGVSRFAPLGVRLSDGSLSVVTPPVVEEWNSTLVVIEGNTRSLHSYINRVDRIECILVRGVTEELPTKPVPISFGAVVSRPPRLRGWHYDRLRRIEDAAHPVN